MGASGTIPAVQRVYRNTLDSQGSECLGGCGRKVITRSGKCVKCRERKCKSCGKMFSWKDTDRSSCHQCSLNNTKFIQKNVHSIFGGDV